MALVLKDRVRETATVVGTGDAALLGAVTGFQAFSVVGDTNTCYYAIADQSGGDWEVGIGTYSTTGPTLARTTVLSSSNAGSKVVFTGGTKDIFLTYPSEKAVYLDAADVVNLTTLDATNVEVTNVKAKDGTAAITLADSTGVATFSANPILNAGTANGVVYANGSKVLTTGSALTFDGTNFATTGSVTSSGASNSGNLTFTGTGNRILGDFSNATIANRVAFQTSTANSNTSISVIPNGTGIVSGINFYGSPDVTNANQAQFAVINGVDARIQSGANGSASFIPMTFYTGGSERLRIDTSGNVGIGTSSPGSAFGSGKTLEATGPIISGGSLAEHQTSKGALQYDSGVTSIRSYGSTAGSGQITLRVGGGGGSTDFEAMRLDSSGNLGLGVTPSAWDSGIKMMDFGVGSAVGNANSFTSTWFASNAYYDTAWKYKNTAQASYYEMASGLHRWYIAPSGTAGNAISFTQAMTLDASGNLLVGTTSGSGARLVVGGTTSGSLAGSRNALHLRNSNSSGNQSNFLAFGSAGAELSCFIGNDLAANGTEINALSFGTNATERMRIDSSGNVGIGSAAPASTRLFIYDQDPIIMMQGSNAVSGSHFNRIKFANAPGSILQEVYGGYYGTGGLYLADYSNTGVLFGVSGAAGTFTERMRIDSSGNVMIGTSNVLGTSGLSVVAGGGIVGLTGEAWFTSGTQYWATLPNSTSWTIYNSDYSKSVSLASQAFTAWSFASDKRIKKNIETLSYGLKEILEIQPREFDYISDGEHDIGFIAQELKEVIPEAVTGKEIPYVENDTPQEKSQKTMGVSKEKLIPVLVKAIQEQQELINQLTARVAQLEGN